MPMMRVVVGADALLSRPTPTPTTAREPSGTPLWGEGKRRHTGGTPRDPYLSQRPDRTRDRRPAEQDGGGRGGEQPSGGGRGAESRGPRRGAGSPGGTVGSRAGGRGGRAPPGPAHLAALTWAGSRGRGPAPGRPHPLCPAAERVPAGRGRPLPPPEGRAAERAQPRARAARRRLDRPLPAGQWGPETGQRGSGRARTRAKPPARGADAGAARGRGRGAERSCADGDQHLEEPAGH